MVVLKADLVHLYKVRGCFSELLIRKLELGVDRIEHIADSLGSITVGNGRHYETRLEGGEDAGASDVNLAITPIGQIRR